jgi:hypothetical protein
MNTSSIGQSRCVEETDLCERSRILQAFTNTGTYQYSILTRKFVNTGRVGLTLTSRTTLLVLLVEDAEVVGIKGLADKDIGDEFQ